jgi:hypothetical protein
MPRSAPLLALAAALALAGCSTADQLVFKGLAGEAPGEYKPTPPVVAEGELAAEPPKLGSTQFQPAPVAALVATGTEAGKKTAAMRSDFVALQAQIAQYGDQLNLFRRSLRLNLDEYEKSIAGLRLDRVRLPDNTPQFAANVDDARSKLGRVNADLLRMNGLAAKITVSAAFGGQLRENIQALAKTPGLGADDARQIDTLDHEVNDAIVLTHQMLADIHNDISKQSTYANGQRDAIDQLAAAVSDAGARPGAGGLPVAPASATTAARRAYVTINFAEPEVDYKPKLYQAVQLALKRRPGLSFEVVGVSPASAGPTPSQSALGRARGVLESLVQMGVPLERLSMSGATSPAAAHDQVQIFVH